MSAWQQTYDAQNLNAVTITTTTETVVLTITGVTVPGAGSRVKLAGSCEVTSGGSTTALTPRWRRGVDATGVLVGAGNPVTNTAGSTVTVVYSATDTPPDSAALTYVLTVQQTGAAANGSSLVAQGTATV